MNFGIGVQNVNEQWKSDCKNIRTNLLRAKKKYFC